MRKNRQIFEAISKIKDSKLGRILVLTGARQVGKTTLVKQRMNGYQYISIEDPTTRAAYSSLTSSQWKELYPQAALDEVQKEPSLIESIKAAYDCFDDVRYILLGSSQLLLLQKVKESLAGRCVIFDMYPLVLPELRTISWDSDVKESLWQQWLSSPEVLPKFLPSFLLDTEMPSKKQAWDFYLKFGGYPALVDDTLTDEQRWLWLDNYVRTFLERDVRDLATFRELEPFVKLQQAVALQTAQTVSFSALGARVGVTSKTAQRYLDYLTISYQAILLPAWERNLTKRLMKSPKVHFLDFGVLQSVLQKRGGITGAEFESAVIAELYKQAKNVMSNAKFYHLRSHDGKEIDLLVELPNGYLAFEIKMSQYVQKSDARHLMTLEVILDKPLICGIVLSNDVNTYQFSDNIFAVNAAMFLG